MSDLPNVDSWIKTVTNIHHYVCAENLLDKYEYTTVMRLPLYLACSASSNNCFYYHTKKDCILKKMLHDTYMQVTQGLKSYGII